MGPGAIGGFLAGALLKAQYEVTVVAPPQTAARLRDHGLCLKTPLTGDTIVHPHIVDQLDLAPDVLCLTTKAGDLAAALSRVRRAVEGGTVVVSLLNGFEHLSVLKSRFPGRLVVGMIGNIVARRDGCGCVVSASRNVKVDLASESVAPDVLGEVAEVFRTGGLNVSVRESEASVVWRKFARLAPLAATTAASGLTLGEIRDAPVWRQRLEAVVAETAAIARTGGVVIEAREVMMQIEALPDSLTTSLSRDIENGSEGELDAIVGALLRRAEQLGLPRQGYEEMHELIRKRITQ